MAQAACRPPLTQLATLHSVFSLSNKGASSIEHSKVSGTPVPRNLRLFRHGNSVRWQREADRWQREAPRQVSRLHAVGSEQSAPSKSNADAEEHPHVSRPLQYGSRFERNRPERTILQKAEDEMNEKCMNMEGEEAYECWQTVFEFEGDKAAAERECILAPPGEKQQACGPLESLQTLVREGSAQGVSAVLANIRASAQSRKARRLAEAKTSPSLVSGAAKKIEADRAEFEVGGGRNAVEVAGGGPPRTESSGEEWENAAAAAADKGMKDRNGRDPSADSGDGYSAMRRVLQKRGLAGVWLREAHKD